MVKTDLIAEYRDLLNTYVDAVAEKDGAGFATIGMTDYLTSFVIAEMYNADNETIARRTESLAALIKSEFPNLGTKIDQLRASVY